MTHTAPERITIKHQNGNTSFQGHGVWDTRRAFSCDYVRRDLAERSDKNHSHEFAVIKDLYDNIPESMMDNPWAKSPEALRKHALIVRGWCETDVIAFPSQKDAVSQAPTIAIMARRFAGYAIVSVQGNCVHSTTPHSQSKSAMGGPAFKQSKADVLDWIKMTIGVEA